MFHAAMRICPHLRTLSLMLLRAQLLQIQIPEPSSSGDSDMAAEVQATMSRLYVHAETCSRDRESQIMLAFMPPSTRFALHSNPLFQVHLSFDPANKTLEHSSHTCHPRTPVAFIHSGAFHH